MFFNATGKSSNLKKAVYLLATTVLGVILSFIAHAVIEMSYLKLAEFRGLTVNFYGGCALPLVFQLGLLFVGAIGGFFLGRFWWRKVYVERVWAKGMIK